MRALVGSLLCLVIACGAPHEQKNIAYDDRFGSSSMLDVYAPDDDGAPRPAVLLIHGGSWRSGFKEQFENAARRLAGAGYVAITINYRLGPEGVFPAAVQDCLCALAYARAHAAELGVDPAGVAVMGYSAGGHLAALLGVAADEPRLAPDCAAGVTSAPAAVISAAGMHDLRDFADYGTVRDFLAGGPDDVPEAYDLASPLLQVGPGHPPFLLIHGDDDRLVGVEQSSRMRDALVASGNDARLLVIEGGGHLWNPGDDGTQTWVQVATETPEAWLAIIDFLDHTIGPP